MKRLCNFDLLLLDELGYLTLNQEQMNMFFKLMDERYTKNRSTIITTDLGYEKNGMRSCSQKAWWTLFLIVSNTAA